MSVTLWIDTPSEKTVELGPTLACYVAFSEMARAAGDAWEQDYPALSGVLSQCESQDDADPAWLADVKDQSVRFLREHGDDLSDSAHRLVATLAHSGGWK